MTSAHCKEHIDTLLEINTVKTKQDTRHRMNMWFLGVLGGTIVLLVTISIPVVLNLNSTLIEISKNQAEYGKMIETNKEEIASLRQWKDSFGGRLNGRHTED